MPKRLLSLNAMGKIMERAGALRISDSAKQAMAQVLEEQGKHLAQEAIKYAEHAGRRTVTNKDIELASKS